VIVFANELASFLQELRTLGVKESIVEEFERVSVQHPGTAERIGLDKVRVFPHETGKLDAAQLRFYEMTLLGHMTVLVQMATGKMPSYSYLTG
jgi:hypothetical protein